MRRACRTMVALAVIAVAASSAAQEPPDDAAKKAAVALADTGMQRFEAGDYKGAIEALRDAEKYVRAPTIRRMRALAHEKLGQLLEARDLYAQIAGEQLPADAPGPFLEAQNEAKKSLESLHRRIPKVEIAVQHAPAGTRVTLDGKPLDAAALRGPIRLNPGRHSIVIEPPGEAKMKRDLDLQEGAVEKVDVDLAPPSPAVISPSAGRSMLGPGIAFGVAGAGLIVGAVTGGLTFAKVGEIRALCGDDLICPRGTEGQVGLEAAKGVGYVSTVAFAVAGAGAIAGVLLFALPGSKKPEPTRAGVVLGPGFLGMKGAF